MKKYEIIKDDSIERFSTKLYRIKALKDFGDVKRGDLGGYIQNEENLSQKGNCWILDYAIVNAKNAVGYILKIIPISQI